MHLGTIEEMANTALVLLWIWRPTSLFVSILFIMGGRELVPWKAFKKYGRHFIEPYYRKNPNRLFKQSHFHPRLLSHWSQMKIRKTSFCINLVWYKSFIQKNKKNKNNKKKILDKNFFHAYLTDIECLE